MRARFLVGRWERRSEEVGIDSGIGSDMFSLGCASSNKDVNVVGSAHISGPLVKQAVWRKRIFSQLCSHDRDVSRARQRCLRVFECSCCWCVRRTDPKSSVGSRDQNLAESGMAGYMHRNVRVLFALSTTETQLHHPLNVYINSPRARAVAHSIWASHAS